VPATAEQLEELRAQLLDDQIYYSAKCLKIVDTSGQLVPLEAKPAQRRFEAIKRRQEAERRPVRIITLKARKEGISTWTQGCMVKRTTTVANHKALVVAHDGDTAEEIFGMGETMYGQLPDEVIGSEKQIREGKGLVLKPRLVGTRKGKELRFGEPSRQRRFEGHIGLNSSYFVDTANEYEAGRGFTYHSVHISELAFYKSAEKKLKALLNAVPDEPGTMIVIESTADGYNLFRKYWVAAITGNNEFAPLFIPWWEEPDYQRPFANAEDREEFIASIGSGDYGEHEPALVEVGVSPEQLHWRRWAIRNKCHGDLRAFWQEYPATWEEAFLSAGRQVFVPALVAKVVSRAEAAEPTAEVGILKPQSYKRRNYMGRELLVPQDPLWIPEAEALERDDVGVGTPMWRRWERPDPGSKPDPESDWAGHPPGQYVITVDASSGRETASEGTDFMAIQVINHRTLEQVAEFHARNIDADQVTDQAFLMALLYSPQWKPWLGVEITGGYGLSIVNKLWRMYQYGMLYFRRRAQQKGEKQDDLLGFSMDATTKPLVVDRAKELLRLERDGIRSAALASEMQTFVKDDKGKMGAEEDYFDDLLDAWMVAQYIAAEKSLRRPPSTSSPRTRLAPSMKTRPRGIR
jgi:hypothetical protein